LCSINLDARESIHGNEFHARRAIAGESLPLSGDALIEMIDELGGADARDCEAGEEQARGEGCGVNGVQGARVLEFGTPDR